MFTDLPQVPNSWIFKLGSARPVEWSTQEPVPLRTGFFIMDQDHNKWSIGLVSLLSDAGGSSQHLILKLVVWPDIFLCPRPTSSPKHWWEFKTRCLLISFPKVYANSFWIYRTDITTSKINLITSIYSPPRLLCPRFPSESLSIH